MKQTLKKILKKTGRFIAGAFLSLCALFILAVMIVQAVLIVGVNLASSGKSTAFLEKKANEALAGSDYRLSFGGLYYDPVRGFTIHDLSVEDAQGPFLSLDRFSLSVSFSQIPLRDLQLLGNGGTLTWLRLPISAQERDEPQAGLQPFPLPDLYFKSVTLLHLSFQSLVMGEDVAGRALVFSPSLQGRIGLDDKISASLRLKPGMEDILPGLPGPGEINLDASFSPASLGVALDRMAVSSPAYKLQAKGNGNFADRGEIDLTVEADYADLGLLTQDNFEKANAKIIVKGPLRNPAIDLTGTAVPGLLKKRGLDDIDFSVTSADIAQSTAGDVRIGTYFREQPVTLTGALSYDASVLTVEKLKGEAPHLTLGGEGKYFSESGLLDARLELSASDLRHYRDLLDVDLAGKLDAAAHFKPGETGQALQFSATVTDVAYGGATARKFSAEADIPALSAFRPQSAKLDIDGLRLSETVTLQTLHAAVTKAGDDQYTLSVKGNGAAPVPVSFSGNAALSALEEKIPMARNIDLAVKTGDSSAKITGSFSPESIDLKLAANNFRAEDIPFSPPGMIAEARLSGTASMTGSPSLPQTNLDISITGVGTEEYRYLVLSLAARHDGAAVSANLSGKGTGIRTLASDVRFPLPFSLIPFRIGLDNKTPLSGKIAADIDLAALSPLFLPPAQALSGGLAMDGTVTGTLQAPSILGALRLSGAAFRDNANGIEIADIAAEAGFTGNSLTLKNLSATDGKNGTITGSGTLTFSGGAGTDVAVRARRFNIPKNDLADAILDADLSLKGAPGGLHLSGAVDIAEMNILIPETFQNRIPELNIVELGTAKQSTFTENLSLGISIKAPNQVFVRGWGLDAEFGGDIEISGDASAPQFNGALSSQRGRLEEFGKRFALEHAYLRFQGDVPPSPYLDVKATTPAGDVTAAILFTGPVKSPSLKFSSTPALPEDEVLSRILFGKEATKISPFQAIQLAQTIRRFSGGGGGGIDPLGLLRSATGLDDISVEMNESGEANVGVGKYLTDKVYLEIEKGKAENSGAATIQIEITPNISVESRTGQDAQTGGGIFWKRDY